MTMTCQYSNSSHRTGIRRAGISLRSWLCALACLAMLVVNPLAAQQSAPTDAGNSRTESVLQNWIPAITIQASEIDLLLQNQRTTQPRSVGGSNGSGGNAFPASLLGNGNFLQNTGPTRLQLPGQLVLRLLPDVQGGSNIGQSAAYAWSLLGNNADRSDPLMLRRSRANSYTSLNASGGNTTPRLLQANEAFTPQLSFGWQLGVQNNPITSASNSDLLGAEQQAMTAAGSLPFASIQCAESVLTSSSYSASGCRFTEVNQQQLLVGLDWNPLPGLNTSAGFFGSSQSALPGWEHYSSGSSNLAAANVGAASMADLLAVSGQQFRGMQIGVQLELLTGNNNIDISADWSRITDFELDAPFLNTAANQNAALAQAGVLQALGLSDVSASNSFNNSGRYISNETLDAASLQINWTNGPFSSGLESVYQQTPMLPGIGRGDDLTTFNLHFTWHTPWHGALSVGANNLLDTTGSGSADLTGDEAINSIYGRIPYVRYKQDL